MSFEQKFWISLPADNDSTFHVSSLLSFLNEQQREAIVLGTQHAPLSQHSQHQSLDFWLRSQVARSKERAQATQEVLKQLCKTGLFRLDSEVPCPDTGRRCPGLRLIAF